MANPLLFCSLEKSEGKGNMPIGGWCKMRDVALLVINKAHKEN